MPNATCFVGLRAAILLFCNIFCVFSSKLNLFTVWSIKLCKAVIIISGLHFVFLASSFKDFKFGPNVTLAGNKVKSSDILDI